MNWYWVVHSRLPSCFFLKITQSLQLTSSKTTVILKEKYRTKTKPKTQLAFKSHELWCSFWHCWAHDLQQLLSHPASFSHLWKRAEIPPSAERTDGYLHSFLNGTKARKRQNIIWRLTMAGFVLWWLPHVLNFIETANSGFNNSTSKAALAIFIICT